MDGLSHFAPRADQAPKTPVMRRHIDHPSAWKVGDFRSADDYSLDLTPGQLADIESCVKAVRAAGLKLEDIERRHFPLPTMAGTIAAIRHEVADGRGFLVLRGLPVEAYSKDEIGFIYWGIGTHLGIGQSQSVMGDRLGHVKDFSREDPNARAYRNKQELSPHTDLSDFVGLCCLRSARSGGVSRLASALTIHNIILAERPQYLERLYRGYTWHRRGEEKPAERKVAHARCQPRSVPRLRRWTDRKYCKRFPTPLWKMSTIATLCNVLAQTWEHADQPSGIQTPPHGSALWC